MHAEIYKEKPFSKTVLYIVRNERFFSGFSPGNDPVGPMPGPMPLGRRDTKHPPRDWLS